MSESKERCIDYWLDTNNFKFVGDFEGMYQNFDDPWGCVKSSFATQRDVLLSILFSEKRSYSSIFDVGCGIGIFTERLRERNGGGDVTSFDVSPTAIQKANARPSDCSFSTFDLTKEDFSNKADLIVMSEVIWYILPQLDEVFSKIHKALNPGGYFCIQQCFPSEQKFGTEYLNSPEDLVERYFAKAGFVEKHQFHQKLPSDTVVMLLGQRKD